MARQYAAWGVGSDGLAESTRELGLVLADITQHWEERQRLRGCPRSC